MVAPQVDFEHACLQFVAAWAAETLAEFLLRAAWCCAAALLHARAAAADAPHTATSISVSDLEACLPSIQTKQKSGSKLSLHHRRGTTLGDLRHVLCILQQQRLLLPQLQQQQVRMLEVSKKSEGQPLVQDCASTAKAPSPNRWLPLLQSQAPPADTTAEAGPATAPSEASTQGHGGAVGQSSSSASASTSAQCSHHSSGQNSIGGGGGQDDSDDDGQDRKRQAYQMTKSHSLETPDPLNAGTSTASLIQAAVDRARGASGDPNATPAATAPAVAAAPQPAAQPSSSTSASSSSSSSHQTPPAAATGPLRLRSPFAAAAAAAAASEDASHAGEEASAGTPSASPPAAVSSPFATVQPTSEQARVRSTPGAASQQSTQPTAGVAPQRLASPFAAAAVAPSLPPAPASTAGKKPRAGRGSTQSSPAASTSSAPHRRSGQQAASPPPTGLPSPFAALQQGSPSPFGSSSSSRSSGSGSGGSSRSRQAAAVAAAAYAASRASKGSSSSVGSRGPAVGTGKLHSPFAATPLPAFSATPSQLDAVAEEEPSATEPAAAAAQPKEAAGSLGAAQLQPMQQAVDALAAAAAAKQRGQGPGSASPAPSAPSSTHSSHSHRSSRPPAAAAPGTNAPHRSSRAQQSPTNAVAAVGPGGIRSPFHAAAAVDAAAQAAFTPAGTPSGVSPAGSPASSILAQSPSMPRTAAPSQAASRKGSASPGNSRLHQPSASSMGQSVSLSTLMQSGAFGTSSALGALVAPPMAAAASSSVLSGSTEGRPAAAAGSSSSLQTARGSGSAGSLTGAAADSAGDRQPAGRTEQQQQPLDEPLPPTLAAWQSPFAAVSATAAGAGAAASAAPAAPAAASGSAAVAGAQPATLTRPQPGSYRPYVMPIAMSAGNGSSLMPPVLLAVPPAQQQQQQQQNMLSMGQAAAVPLAMYPAGSAAAGGAGGSLLLPQYVLPVSSGLVSAGAAGGVMGANSAGPATSAGLVAVSAGTPALLVHPSLLPAMQQASMAQPVPSSMVRIAAAASAGQSPAGSSRHMQPAPAPAGPQAAGAMLAAAAVSSTTESAAASAGSGGPVLAPAVKLSCMCVAPACLVEGQASQVQIYVLGLEGKKVQQGPGSTYRVAAFMGPRLVAETHRVCKGAERLLRVAVPPLPKGVLQVLVLDAFNKPCFMQHLLVLPQPCAQDMNSLWSQLLKGQIDVGPAAAPGAAAAQAADASGRLTPGSSPFGSSSSTASSKSAQAGTGTSSSSVTSAAPPASSDTAAPRAEPAKRLGPQEIQALWRHFYGKVVAQVATVLLTRSRPRPEQLLPPTRTASTAPAPAGVRPRSSFDTPEMQDRVSSLLHFFATHGKWAVLELLTAHVYGYGSSARAMYTSKVLPQPAGAARGGDSAAVAVAEAARAAAAAAVAAPGATGSAPAPAPVAAADAAVVEAARHILGSWCSAIPAAQQLLASLQPQPVNVLPVAGNAEAAQQLLNSLMQAPAASLAAAMASAAALPGSSTAGTAAPAITPPAAAVAAAPEGTGEILVEPSMESFSFCAEAAPQLPQEDAAAGGPGAPTAAVPVAGAAGSSSAIKSADRSLLRGLQVKLKRALSVKQPV